MWRPNNKTRKLAPVDVAPADTGNVVLEAGGAYRVLTKAEIIELDTAPALFGPEPADRYTLHFATCPDADHFRRCGTCHQKKCRCRR